MFPCNISLSQLGNTAVLNCKAIRNDCYCARSAAGHYSQASSAKLNANHVITAGLNGTNGVLTDRGCDAVKNYQPSPTNTQAAQWMGSTKRS